MKIICVVLVAVYVGVVVGVVVVVGGGVAVVVVGGGGVVVGVVGVITVKLIKFICDVPQEPI